jgi:hypothetical protein
VFFAQEREVTLTWSIAEKYIGHFLQRDTMFRDILFSRKTCVLMQEKDRVYG